jgi:hypothetical protein
VAAENFTLYQPSTPDGTVRLGVGNSGATTGDVVTVNSAGVTVTGTLAGGNLSYTGTLTGGTGVVNLGSGQFYKDASGNVGIGTSSPAYKLDVQGGNIRNLIEASRGGLQLFAYSSAQTYDAPRIETWRARGTAASPSVVSSGDELFSLQCSGRNANSAWTYAGGIFMYATGTVTGSNVPSYISFETNSGSAGAERARIDSSGNLLVGRTTTANFSSSTTSGFTWQGTVCTISSASTDPLALQRSGSDGAIVSIWKGTSQVGSISVTGSATAYNTSSDYRLKHDIAPMTGALAKVALLKPCTYKWNADDSDGEGFIAHELQAVVPDCVTGEKDAVDADGKPVYQGIDTSFLVATLTAAIQEQQALIAALQADVAALKGAQA